MIITAITLAALAFPGPELTKHQRETLSAVQKAYEANRSALGARGTLRFHCQHGLVSAANLDDFDRAIKSDWQRKSASKGLYVFDSPYRKYENIYTPEQLVAERRLISLDEWKSNIWSARLLTDGETTLIANFDVLPKDGEIVHNGNLQASDRWFYVYSGTGIPLELGRLDPLWFDLGKCLQNLLNDGGKSTLVSLDEEVDYEGMKVMRIEVKPPDSPMKQVVTYWVDLEHGAIPVKYYFTEFAPHSEMTSALYWYYRKPKWVGKGWLPMEWTTAAGNVSASGSLRMLACEYTIDEVDYETKPDPSVFALDFPRDMPLSDSDRNLGFGTQRVWHVKDFSPEVRAKKRPRTVPVAAAVEMPEMPDARDPWSLAAILMMIAGAALLAVAGIGAYKRYSRV